MPKEAGGSHISQLSRQILLPGFLSLTSPNVGRVKKGPPHGHDLPRHCRHHSESRSPCAIAHTLLTWGSQVSRLMGFLGLRMSPSLVRPITRLGLSLVASLKMQISPRRVTHSSSHTVAPLCSIPMNAKQGQQLIIGTRSKQKSKGHKGKWALGVVALTGI